VSFSEKKEKEKEKGKKKKKDKDGNRQHILSLISFVILLLTLLQLCTLSPAALHKFSTIIQLCIIV